MKNKEKYIDFIVKAFANVDVDDCEFRKKHILKQKNCNGADCVECNIRTAEWLEQEYQGPIILTEDEKTILKNLPKNIKWIARDRIGNLFLYLEKPRKEDAWWKSRSLEYNLSLYKHLFQSIKQEDEEPYNIDELLKENGVER